ncbi:DnaE-like DNA polymerase III [Gordonia phage RedWattleHog]|uniref:DNA-directed DNA polymerase n=1 Tax=Gordonia phage Stormageddon TaxID=2656541 RepID=A0A649VSL7_9CAUD|nr:DNA polymerase [Gordonia phage Stormageddon]QGJ94939.1 DnaE-like DNA polymerase III [Gordonia phage Stormageddon]QLF83583.1 DnaE-like DNA polymerase III [Gordonia phage RedWattleHog]
MSKYVGLHVHSQHSFLDGEASLDAMVSRIKSLGQSGGAITDHQECSGHVSFYKKMTEAGLRPVLGMEGYFHPEAHRAKELKLKASDYSHITVLARNQEGLRNLWAWSSIAYTQHFYYRAIVDWQDMKDLSAGLWASDGCGLAFMAKAIVAGDDQLQHELMGRYLDTFGDHFYMELHTFQFLDPQTEDQVRLNRELTMMNQRKVELAEAYGVPLVVVNDAHYAPPDDWKKHNLVWSMSTQQNADQTGKGQTAAWMMDEPELFTYMRRHGISDTITRQAIDNTAMIAESCDVEIKPQQRMPAVNASETEDVQQFLGLLEQGMKRRVIDRGLDEETYRKRLETEVKVIVDNHFTGYFNVVHDLVRAAKDDKDMFVGPGRGSAGGALCSYLMGITELDPIKYDLLFERFLAEGRGGFPDIDIDLQQSRLAEAKEYTAQRYGHDHVCGIGTFTRSAPKSILNDICRAMSVPIQDSKAISKAIGKLPANAAHTPQQRWDTMLELKHDRILPWVRKYPEVFSYAQKMIGMVRQSSVHASGWIISSDPLTGDLPLRSKDGKVVSQFEQGDVEWLGYVKFDLLGIRHLDTIKWTLDAIKERHGVDINPYEFTDAEFCDPAIWDRIGKGDTLGLFQLEADLMASTAKKHKPQSEREVAELLAINRPGVIDAGLLQPYIDRKHGREEVTYDHPMLEEIVGETYGILIYQEQIMKMSRVIADFTPADADWLRKVVGKKKVNELPALKEKFVEGARANRAFISGCHSNPEAVIQKLWTSIEASGEYLFNKSHSVAYALVGTWEAWLRHYYYPEFIAACMRSDPEKVPRYVRHAELNGVRVLPPDINQSRRDFVLTDDGVRYGMTTVKHVGDTAYDEIVRTRPFDSLADMMDKVAKRAVGKRVMTNLIRIGAFDKMNPDRAAVEREFYELRKIKEKDQPELPDYEDLTAMYQLEKQLVGSSILYDPLRDHHQMISALCVSSPDALDELRTGDVAKVGGLVTAVKPHKTKKGEWMGFLTITFDAEDYEVLVFPEAWASSKMLLELDTPVIARVIKLRDDAVHLSQVQRLDWLTSGREAS